MVGHFGEKPGQSGNCINFDEKPCCPHSYRLTWRLLLFLYSWLYDFSILRSSGMKIPVCSSNTQTFRRSSTTVANFFFKVVKVRYLPTYLYLTMASDGSPRPTGRNMIEPSANMAQTSFYYACAEATILKRPHRTIFDQDIWWESSWLFGWFLSCWASTRN